MPYLNLVPNSNHTKPPCSLEAISKNQYLCVKLNGDFNYNSFWPALYLAITPPKQSLQHCYFTNNTSFFFSHTIYTIKEVEHRTENNTRFKTAQMKRLVSLSRVYQKYMPKAQLLKIQIFLSVTPAHISLIHSDVLLHWEVKICHRFNIYLLSIESLHAKRKLTSAKCVDVLLSIRLPPPPKKLKRKRNEY